MNLLILQFFYIYFHHKNTYRFTALVGLFVEFIEQEEEHNGMHTDPPNESFRIIAINEE